MCGSRFTTCGEFRLNPNPVEIDEWGFWEIATEDGVTFIAVPVHLYAASPDTSKIAHEKGDEIIPAQNSGPKFWPKILAQNVVGTS